MSMYQVIIRAISQSVNRLAILVMRDDYHNSGIAFYHRRRSSAGYHVDFDQAGFLAGCYRGRIRWHNCYRGHQHMITTKAQRAALKRVYDRGDTTRLPETYRQFRRRAWMASYDTCIMIVWCGMMLGIEIDGYTHS